MHTGRPRDAMRKLGMGLGGIVLLGCVSAAGDTTSGPAAVQSASPHFSTQTSQPAGTAPSSLPTAASTLTSTATPMTLPTSSADAVATPDWYDCGDEGYFMALAAADAEAIEARATKLLAALQLPYSAIAPLRRCGGDEQLVEDWARATGPVGVWTIVWRADTKAFRWMDLDRVTELTSPDPDVSFVRTTAEAWLERAGIEVPAGVPDVDADQYSWRATWARHIDGYLVAGDYVQVRITPEGELRGMTATFSVAAPAPQSPITKAEAKAIARDAFDGGWNSLTLGKAELMWMHPFWASTGYRVSEVRLAWYVPFYVPRGWVGTVWVDAETGVVLGHSARVDWD